VENRVKIPIKTNGACRDTGDLAHIERP